MGSSKEAFCHRIDVWHSMAFSFRSVGLCAESRSRGRGFQGHKSFLIKESGLTEGLLQSQLGVWYECNKSRYQADFTQEQIRSIYYVLRISLTMSSTTLGDDGQEEFGWQFGGFTQVRLGPTTASWKFYLQALWFGQILFGAGSSRNTWTLQHSQLIHSANY